MTFINMLIDMKDVASCLNDSQAAILPSAGEQRDCNKAADGKLSTSNLKMVLGFY